MNPIGLTLAEEEREHRSVGRTTVGQAGPGALGCRATLLPDGRVCGAEARIVVVWPDGDRTLVCDDCALRLRILAESHRVRLRTERVTPLYNG